MRLPRILPPRPCLRWRPPADTAWCTPCRTWRPFDVIPADTANDIPAFPICMHCGTQVDIIEEAS